MTTDSQLQAEKIYALQQSRVQKFRTGTTISLIILLVLLIVAFSGIDLTGMGIPFRTIQLDSAFMRENAAYIIQGLGDTILLAIVSIFLAGALALLGALGRLSKFPPAYAIATFYVSLIRGTPLLLQLFFFFLALPQLGIRLNGWTAGVLALGINYGAYMSETFRAGIQSVGQGQREAALAIGMNQRQILTRVVLPQALRIIIPPFGNDFISMLKDTALVAATGFVHEVLWRANTVGRQKFKSMETLLIAALCYWAITIIFSALQTRLEAYLARGERGR
ncbi:MAG TPA: amino acid ABC transporter permease [Anaerolineales bacterium]|nr:amino acid ABC transporter permease [Anaerolineales bacterium]